SPVDGRLFLAYPRDSNSAAFPQSFDKLQILEDGGSDIRFIHDPYATTFGGFSKVTNFFRAALRPPETSVTRTNQGPGLPSQPDNEPGFELITCHINELTMKLDLQTVLREAEAIYLQFVCCKVSKGSHPVIQ
ncbi:hypothetical protein XENOCAPTIV_012419, partial [Xenoophorus captivus]